MAAPDFQTLEYRVHYPVLERVRNMFRFDQLIRRDMIVRDVKQRFPETVLVFEQFGFRPICDDCDIESIARKNGHDSRDVVEALNQVAFGSKAATDEHASNQAQP